MEIIMAYRENAKILKADCLADGVYEIWFETKDIAKAAKAGQFISVYSNDGSRMLPRPISICKVENNNLRIVFRVAGKGTEEFSKMKAGEYLDIQGPLGNGYDLGKTALPSLCGQPETKIITAAVLLMQMACSMI
jgi:dihydroorotate dehydrogenase electron transfer subunit